MRQTIVLLGVACTIVCTSAVGAEAKLIRYEVNGQQYSYSTNNRQQTREARQRIEAAKAAEAAKARADAEAAANPLARLFGSPAQREAAEAQGRLQQVLPNGQAAAAAPALTAQPAAAAEAQPEVTSTSSVRRPRAERRRAVVRRERTREVRQASLARPDRIEAVREPKPASPALAVPETDAAKRAERSMPEPVTPVASAPAAAPPPMVQSAPPALPVLPSDDKPRSRGNDGGSLTDFVNQLRKAPGEAPRL